MVLKVGDIVEAKVTGIVDYGFFVEIEDFSGLCHISEISNDFVDDINKFVSIGDIIFVEILEIDYEKKHLKISIKDIYYRSFNDGTHITETRRGFLPLKQNLDKWIVEKINEYNKKI